MGCLSCSELEAKICALAEEIAAASGCDGKIFKDEVGEMDYSPAIEAKQEVLRTYRDLYAAKCGGVDQLYEFIHVPCVKPDKCVGSSCGSRITRPTRRRYR